MSLKSRYKKKFNKYVGKATMGMFGGEKESSSDEAGLRSAAAKRLVNTQQQAGSGQIKFQTEELI
jgi:hypothetical protein